MCVRANKKPFIKIYGIHKEGQIILSSHLLKNSSLDWTLQMSQDVKVSH